MKKILFLVLLSIAGRFIVRELLQDEQRERLAHLPATVMEKGMEMMPENSPPKVFMSSLRRLQEQNEELVALVREQNDILRKRLPAQES